jgi:hypothetical protein
MMEDGDFLCNLDADNFTGEGFATYITGMLHGTPERFLLARRNPPGLGGDLLPKGINGRTVVSRQAFLIAGGYDESKYQDWGPDDKDFNARLRRLGYQPHQIERRYLDAILHNDKMRFKDYPHAHTAYETTVAAESEVTIANFGNFGRGVVFKNFDFSRPIILGTIPTRIFGIGLHKTGTTSLHTALRMLGFDSAHWKTAHWAKAIWNEMQATGRSLTLEKSYALCDLPITLLYRELDRAYPNSKFILTVRDEDHWLRSVANHWNHDLNPFRRAWDTDPFSHQIHKEIYGQRNFDPTVFLERYRRHNIEVREYFKDRPNDLLIMEMSSIAEGQAYDGWPKLCQFLGQPIPTAPYPIKFQTVFGESKKENSCQ